MKFRVIITRSAEADADEIYDWIRERSPAGAGKWWRAFLQAIDLLRKNADSFGQAAEARAGIERLHELMFKTRHGRTYRIVFNIRGDTVYALRVRTTGQSLLTPDEIDFPE